MGGGRRGRIGSARLDADIADVLNDRWSPPASADVQAVGCPPRGGHGRPDAGLAGLPVVARLEPDASRSRRYRSKLERYRGLYHALAELR